MEEEKKWTLAEFNLLSPERKNGKYTFYNGTVGWWEKGFLHREEEPALFDESGYYWYKYGLLHREDGPAIIKLNGDKHWFKEGLLHRLDGPAIERVYEPSSWFIEGKRYTEEEWKIVSFAILNNLQVFL